MPNFLKSTEGFDGKGLHAGVLKNWITGFAMLVALFLVVSSLWPTLTTAGNSLNSSIGGPIGPLFAGGGLIFIVLAIAILLLIFGVVMPSKGK